MIKESKIVFKIKVWAKKMKDNIELLWIIYNHSKTPWYAKALVMITVGYALSPIDLIPDFIPILGFLDDAILLPGLIWLSFKLIPNNVIDECRQERKNGFLDKKPKNYIAAVFIVLIWIGIIVAIGRLLS